MNADGGFIIRGGALDKYTGSEREITLPAGTTAVSIRAFTGTAVERVIIPEGVKRLGMNAFERCESLGEIILPESLGYIGREAFLGCTSLKRITIPRETSRLNSKCFYGCSSLTEVTLHEGLVLGGDAFGECPSVLWLKVGSVSVKIPASARNSRCFERVINAVRYRRFPPMAGLLPPQITAQLAAELYFRFSDKESGQYIGKHAADVFEHLAIYGRDDLLRELASEKELIGSEIEQLIDRSISLKKHEITIMLTALRHGSLPAESVSERFEL